MAKKGEHLSEKTRKKISKALTGKKLPKEVRRKISKTCKRKGIRPPSSFGRKHTEEWKKNFSDKMKGRISPMKGKKQSKEARKKMSEAHKGEKSNLWKGGITKENKAIRANVEFRLWREAVFSRDSWTCQKCKKRGIYLHPHHIQNFAEYPELRFAIDNGITFCRRCHNIFHKRFGYNNNNKKQLLEFLE